MHACMVRNITERLETIRNLERFLSTKITIVEKR